MPMGIDQTLCSGWYSEQGGAARGRFKFSFHKHMYINLSRAVYRAGPGGGHKDRESSTRALRKSQLSREGSTHLENLGTGQTGTEVTMQQQATDREEIILLSEKASWGWENLGGGLCLQRASCTEQEKRGNGLKHTRHCLHFANMKP